MFVIRIILLVAAILCASITGAFIGIDNWQYWPLLYLCFMAGIGATSIGEDD